MATTPQPLTRRAMNRLQRWHPSVYLILGLVVSVACLGIFAKISEEVLENDPMIVVDTALANQLHAQATPLSTSFYRVLSWIGAQGLIVLTLVAIVIFVARRRWLNLAFWFIALSGGLLLNLLIKQIVGRPRPLFVDPLALEQTYSFPSAHSMLSLIAYGMAAYFLWHVVTNRYGRTVIVFGTSLLIILIGISRMTLGVHYLSDVLGGFAAGVVWLTMCITALEVMKHRA